MHILTPPNPLKQLNPFLLSLKKSKHGAFNFIPIQSRRSWQMKARNSAILAKLCWRIASNPKANWAKMLTTKYLTPVRLSERGRRLPASRTWAACKDGGAIFNKGLKWSLQWGGDECLG